MTAKSTEMKIKQKVCQTLKFPSQLCKKLAIEHKNTHNFFYGNSTHLSQPCCWGLLSSKKKTLAITTGHSSSNVLEILINFMQWKACYWLLFLRSRDTLFASIFSCCNLEQREGPGVRLPLSPYSVKPLHRRLFFLRAAFYFFRFLLLLGPLVD